MRVQRRRQPADRLAEAVREPDAAEQRQRHRAHRDEAPACCVVSPDRGRAASSIDVSA